MQYLLVLVVESMGLECAGFRLFSNWMGRLDDYFNNSQSLYIACPEKNG